MSSDASCFVFFPWLNINVNRWSSECMTWKWFRTGKRRIIQKSLNLWKYYETWNLSRNLWYTPRKFFANSEFTPESHDAWKMIRLIFRGLWSTSRGVLVDPKRQDGFPKVVQTCQGRWSLRCGECGFFFFKYIPPSRQSKKTYSLQIYTSIYLSKIKMSKIYTTFLSWQSFFSCFGEMEEAQSSIFLFERIWIIGANSSQPDWKNESTISTGFNWCMTIVSINCMT